MASQPDPWAEFRSSTPPPAPMPTERRGRPRLPPPQTPTDAALAEERLRAARLERELAEERRRRTQADPAGDSGVDQRRQAGFYLRATRANELYEQNAVEPRGVIGQTAAEMFPRAANALSSTERQQAEAAQRDFIASTLRYESGAAIPPSEFASQATIYFPQPGDAPETIAAKATLRRNALEALQRSAGQAGTGIESTPASTPAPYTEEGDTGRAIAQMGASVAQNPSATISGGPGSRPGDRLTTADTGEPPVGSQYDMGRGQNVLGVGGDAPITDEQRQAAMQIAQQATALARGGASPEDIDHWFAERGIQPMSAESRAELTRLRRSGRPREFRGFSPNLETRPKAPSEIIGDALNGDGSGVQAVAINALDTASFGLPALFSEDYRNRIADVREENPIASTVGSIAGGLLAPGGPRPGMSLLQQSGRTAGQGAFYGFNSTGGDPEAALAGGVIGGAAPAAFRAAGTGARYVQSAFRRAPAVTAEGRVIAQAAADENVPISRPIVDQGSRDRMAYLDASRGSGNVVREGLADTRDAIERRAGEIAGTGTVEPLDVMGQRVQDAGTRYIEQTGANARRLYDRAANLAGDTPVLARDAVAEIDNQLAQLGRNPSSNAGEINFLQGLRSDLIDDAGNLIPKTVADIRDLRTGLRGRVGSNNLTMSQVETRVLGILERARGDIERDLGGPRAPAVRAYRRADEFYAQRQGEIRNVVQRVIGPRDANLSGEQVMTRLRTMAGNRGDAIRLGRMWEKLSPEEQADAAATIAATAGRRSAEEGFEPGQFLTWARSLSPAARQTIFGPQGAQSIENLRTLSRALMDTTSRLNNSRSGQVMNWRNVLTAISSVGGAGVGALSGGSMLTTGVTGLAIGAGATGAGMLTRRLSARALMSNDMSRWLANAPQAANPSAIRAHIARLEPMARLQRNQPIAQEILGLRDALLNAVNDNVAAPMRAAADSGSTGGDDR